MEEVETESLTFKKMEIIPSIRKQHSVGGRPLNWRSEAQFQTLSSLILGWVICKMRAEKPVSRGFRLSTGEASLRGALVWGSDGSPSPTQLQTGSSVFLCFMYWLPWEVSLTERFCSSEFESAALTPT